MRRRSSRRLLTSSMPNMSVMAASVRTTRQSATYVASFRNEVIVRLHFQGDVISVLELFDSDHFMNLKPNRVVALKKCSRVRTNLHNQGKIHAVTNRKPPRFLDIVPSPNNGRSNGVVVAQRQNICGNDVLAIAAKRAW